MAASVPPSRFLIWFPVLVTSLSSAHIILGDQLRTKGGDGIEKVENRLKKAEGRLSNTEYKLDMTERKLDKTASELAQLEQSINNTHSLIESMRTSQQRTTASLSSIFADQTQTNNELRVMSRNIRRLETWQKEAMAQQQRGMSQRQDAMARQGEMVQQQAAMAVRRELSAQQAAIARKPSKVKTD